MQTEEPAGRTPPGPPGCRTQQQLHHCMTCRARRSWATHSRALEFGWEDAGGGNSSCRRTLCPSHQRRYQSDVVRITTGERTGIRSRDIPRRRGGGRCGPAWVTVGRSPLTLEAPYFLNPTVESFSYELLPGLRLFWDWEALPGFARSSRILRGSSRCSNREDLCVAPRCQECDQNCCTCVICLLCGYQSFK